MEEKNSKFFKTYYILAFVYALVGIFDSFFLGSKGKISQVSIIYLLIIGLFGFAIFILSIVALVIFIKNKFSKIALVMPIYHIAMHIFMFIYGIVLGITYILQGLAMTEASMPSITIFIGMISSWAELFFSGYILYKFR